MQFLQIDGLKDVIERVSQLMEENKDKLIDLDSAIGDGDLGLTMSKGFHAAVASSRIFSESDVGRFLFQIGMAIGSAAPSTMGTLIAAGFLSAGKALAGVASLDLRALAVLFQAFADGIMQRGRSKPGEKTILDVFCPAAKALADASDKGASSSRRSGSMLSNRCIRVQRHEGNGRSAWTAWLLP